jgi:hypothetical protein
MPSKKTLKSKSSRRKKPLRAKKKHVDRKATGVVPKQRHSRSSTTKAKEGVTGKAKKRTSRSYTPATLGKLWGLSGNQCAFPGCPHELIALGTKSPAKAIVGNICHIYAASDKGPRGKLGLTIRERNAFENLILMCGHHHPRVDKLYEDYPASDLLKWKQEHEAKALQNTPENLKRQADIQKLAFFQQISDQQIDHKLDRLIRARALNGFPAADEAETLATQVEGSNFSGGSDEVRARALAWCARVLSAKDPGRATALLTLSRKLASTPDATLAEAFLLAKSDKNAAMSLLRKQNSPASMTAALRIETNASGFDAATMGALFWLINR